MAKDIRELLEEIAIEMALLSMQYLPWQDHEEEIRAEVSNATDEELLEYITA